MDPKWKAFILSMGNATREEPAGPTDSLESVPEWVGWLVGGLVAALVTLAGVFVACRKGLLQLGQCLEAAGGFFRQAGANPEGNGQPAANPTLPNGQPTGVGSSVRRGRTDDSLEMRLASNEREQRRTAQWSDAPGSECV